MARFEPFCLALTHRNHWHKSNRNIQVWENCVADTGYSSGENYAFLERQGIKSFIPPHGTYKGGPKGFDYIEDGNYWLCPQGKKVTFRKQKLEKGTLKDNYFTRRSDWINRTKLTPLPK